MPAALNELLDDLEDTGQITDDAALADAFSQWAASTGRPLYPHQEQALLEILSGNHVIAATPTGSGKSMIALSAHFISLARGGRSYYTAPLKALVSEKFFDLVHAFGAHNVGMVTGDVSLNPDAPIVCCTAEILANESLREGADLDTDMIIMDEFHFYGDPQRGWAWQVPLLELVGHQNGREPSSIASSTHNGSSTASTPNEMDTGSTIVTHAVDTDTDTNTSRIPDSPQFIALSATLGDTNKFQRTWKERTGRDVALVNNAERPVPLEFSYEVEMLPDIVERLLGEGRWPIYIVHFSQKEAVDTASKFDRSKLISPEQKIKITEALKGVDFGKGFGQTLRHYLVQGIGIHHAGMLPRYRRLVERLTQQGLLAIVSGTDTLGVGINVPIRTVLMTSLIKFDGSRMRHLSAREFHQIAGRAGRAGYDTVGFVRVLAPENEVEASRERARLTAAQEAAQDARSDAQARKRAAKAAKSAGKKSRKAAGGTAGQISWTRSTFERLRDASPEQLQSQFAMSHSMVLNVLSGNHTDPGAHLLHLATENDDPIRDANPHIRRLADIYRSLRQSGVIDHVSSKQAVEDHLPRIRLMTDLPDEFALNQPLSPFALAALELLDPQSPTYSLDVVSVIESVLEDPRPLLYAQQRVARADAVVFMKAEGLDYDQRMEALEDVTWPRPLQDLLENAFTTYVRANPWVGDREISPKSVIREMVENAMTFTELVSRYDVGRSEGVILRYLTDAYRSLRQIVPETMLTDDLRAMIEWLSQLIRSVDSSLLDEWEALASGNIEGADAAAHPGGTSPASSGVELAFGAGPDGVVAFSANRHAFRAAIRKAVFRKVELMSRDNVSALASLEPRATDESVDRQRSATSLPVSMHLPGEVSANGTIGWDSERWDETLREYWDQHDWIGIDQRAQSPSLLHINESPDRADLISVGLDEPLADYIEQNPQRFWIAEQTLVDPEDDGDWRLKVLIDVTSSDECHQVVMATLSCGAL